MHGSSGSVGVGGRVPLQNRALGWLARQPQVDYMLVGLTKSSYVDEAVEAIQQS